MALKNLLVIFTVVSVACGQSSSYAEVPSKVLQVPEYVASGGPSLSFQLPSEDAPVPFNSYAPATELKPPVAYETPIYNQEQVPIPSQDLELPSINEWNPENDPTLFYELPIEITKEVQPTNLHPKKYDKQVFEKVKPVAYKPKEEIALVPVKVQELIQRQNQQDKTLLSYAKAENQKALRVEKVKEPVAEATGFHESASSSSPASNGQRVEFQMHGHNGPKSYKWGYDTGKGHNRHFRYEERDKDGFVKGHYGYMDTHGKLQMVHYDSHPHEGFHAKGNFGEF